MFSKIQYILSLKNQLIVGFVFLFQTLFGQYFEFQWTDKLKFANNKDGFFAGFLNTNGQNIYALNTNYAVSPLKKNTKLKLIAYNKTSMVEVATVALKGYPENEGNESEYSAIDYYKTVVLDDKILVFWTKLINTDTTKTEELYVESFKIDLERDQGLKKVYETIQKVDSRQSEYAPIQIIVQGCKDISQVLIGSEIHETGKNVLFKYVTLNSQLSSSNGNKVILPLASEPSKNTVTSQYELGHDGLIYIRSKVNLTHDEKQKLRPNEPSSFLVLSVVNPGTKEKITLPLKGDSKTITDYSLMIGAGKTKLFGFFGDLTKDPSGVDKQGIFYTEIDQDTIKENALKYSYFEKTSLSKLFPRSKGARKKKSKEPAKPLTEEELNTRFDIENIFKMDDGSYVLFFSRKYNTTEITSKSGGDGKNIYKTAFFCEKNNVSAIRMTDQGKILWTSNIDRSIIYEGTDVADVKVVFKYNKFFVMYGSQSTEDSKDKSEKKESKYKDNIDYAVFDLGTGKVKKLNALVNDEDVLPKEKRYLDPLSVNVYDNTFYFSKMDVKQKTGWYVANILCFPTIYYSVLSGNTKCGSGDFTVMNVMEGKPNKKKKEKKK